MKNTLEYLESPENIAGPCFPTLILPFIGSRDAFSKRQQIPLNKLPETLVLNDQLKVDRELALACIGTWFINIGSAIDTYIGRVKWNPTRQPFDHQRALGLGNISEYLAICSLSSQNQSSFDDERERLRAAVYQEGSSSGRACSDILEELVVIKFGAEKGRINGWELNTESPVIARLA